MKAISDDEIKGTKFGRLTPVERMPNLKLKRVWRCICDCGGEKDVLLNSLRIGRTQSCGCIKREQSSERKFAQIHGECHKSLEHSSWSAMHARCNNEKHHAYANYGGRGIKVCDRWSGPQGYQNFLKDMGRRPNKSWSLDRIDGRKSYFPENCRWATSKTQLRNTRVNVRISYQGRTQTMADWADETSIDYATFAYRHRTGWDMHRIMTTPSSGNGRRGPRK